MNGKLVNGKLVLWRYEVLANGALEDPAELITQKLKNPDIEFIQLVKMRISLRFRFGSSFGKLLALLRRLHTATGRLLVQAIEQNVSVVGHNRALVDVVHVVVVEYPPSWNGESEKRLN